MDVAVMLVFVSMIVSMQRPCPDVHFPVHVPVPVDVHDPGVCETEPRRAKGSGKTLPVQSQWPGLVRAGCAVKSGALGWGRGVGVTQCSIATRGA